MCGPRETWEEVGIDPSSVEVWGCLPEIASSQKGDYTAAPVIGTARIEIIHYSLKFFLVSSLLRKK